MAFVSVTRARARSLWGAFGFARAALPAFRQAGAAPGFLAGSVLRDRRLTFWTLTVWECEAAMRAYMTSGAHKAALPRFATLCDEASVTHWEQAEPTLPAWSLAAERMRREGRPSKVRRPGPHHADMSYAEPRLTVANPIPVMR